jgi:hypothetical protein
VSHEQQNEIDTFSILRLGDISDAPGGKKNVPFSTKTLCSHMYQFVRVHVCYLWALTTNNTKQRSIDGKHKGGRLCSRSFQHICLQGANVCLNHIKANYTKEKRISFLCHSQKNKKLHNCKRKHMFASPMTPVSRDKCSEKRRRFTCARNARERYTICQRS